MTKMKGAPAKHTEELSGKAFSRHFIAGVAAESCSYDELKARLDSLDSKEYLDFLYNEQRFLNIIFLIQWLIPEIVGNAYQSGYIKNEESLYKLLIGRTKENWKLADRTEAEQLLDSETEGSKSRAYTPHAMLYVAGLGLGDFIHILDSYVSDPCVKTNDILPLLRNVNETRNYFIHVPLSSRIDLQEKIHNTMNDASVTFQILNDAHDEQFKRKK